MQKSYLSKFLNIKLTVDQWTKIRKKVGACFELNTCLNQRHSHELTKSLQRREFQKKFCATGEMQTTTTTSDDIDVNSTGRSVPMRFINTSSVQVFLLSSDLQNNCHTCIALKKTWKRLHPQPPAICIFQNFTYLSFYFIPQEIYSRWFFKKYESQRRAID